MFNDASSTQVEELPEWINLGALATPEEIAERRVLAIGGMELLPAVAAWIRDAAPLWDRPPLLEMVESTRELVYVQMGVTGLAEVVDRFRELVSVFEASGTELDNRLTVLHAEHVGSGRAAGPDTDDLFERPDGSALSASDGALGAVSEERLGRWRARPRVSY